MALTIISLCILLAGGLAAAAASLKPRAATWFGAGSAVLACIVGLVPAFAAALGAPAQSWTIPWSMPLGSLSLGLDALSGFFLIPILGLAALAALYGARYLLAHHPDRPLGLQWLFFNALILGMCGSVLARDGLLFLVAWEVMALASFFLVLFENDKPSVRRAGWIYFVATHLGTAFLLAMFAIMATHAGSLEFARLAATSWTGIAGLLFILAVVGFGTKAGFVPLHVWLPEAHPAAPSHVSALMSGVMIKTGIYGLVRLIVLLGAPAPWWGVLLIAIGLTSGVLGVLFALAQHDIKRLLAYHSVENIGIIALGLGVGIVGLAAGSPVAATLGFAGGLLHVLNHAVFKGLLFLGAGAVLHGTGTRDMDHLGGLGRRMPWTAMTFVIGAAAIAGLPPLNGFVSELLVYVGAASGGIALSAATATPLFLVVGGLALIGGLAAACFAKAFGIVFLGEPRSDKAAQAAEVPLLMRAPMLLLALACVLLGVGAPLALGLVRAAVRVVTGAAASVALPGLSLATSILVPVVIASAALFALVLLLVWLRHGLLKEREVRSGPTWDCGYAAPSNRMQYTSSSFAQPLVALFAPLLGTRRSLQAPQGPFPQHASFSSTTPDLFDRLLFEPLFAGTAKLLAKVRVVQHGRVHLYVLNILITILALLVWQLS